LTFWRFTNRIIIIIIIIIKTVPEMTYNVFSGTLNPTHFTSLHVLDNV